MTSIIELESEIRKHNTAYWVDNNPIISDAEYDALIEKLRVLDPNNDLLSVYSVEKVVGDTVKHAKTMRSLKKCYSLTELIRWFESLLISKNSIISISPKYDGCSAEFLNSATLSTRGDGVLGENISSKIRCIIRPVDLTWPEYGEIVVTNDVFNSNKLTVLKTDGSQYKTTRSMCAGLINSDTNPPTGLLRFVPFNTHEIHVTGSELYSLDLDKLERQFKTYGIPLDGIVFRVKDEGIFESLGHTDHHPKGAIAYKFSNPKGVTKLVGVTFQVGAGKITPVGEIDPVEISGVMNSRIGLHNLRYIYDNDLHIGDTIEIERCGEIIPQFTRIVKKGPRNTLILCETCPSCGEPTKYIEPDIVCENPDCVGQIEKKLLYALNRLQIDHFGPGTICKMVSMGLKKVSDFINVDKPTLLSVEGFGPNMADKVLSHIADRKAIGCYDYQVLAALSIPGVSTVLAKQILQSVSLAELVTMDAIRISSIQNIGMSRGLAIAKVLKSSRTELVTILKSMKVVKTTGVEKRPTVCMTGKYDQPRSWIEAEVQKYGYEAVKTVTRDTSLLLCADLKSESNKMALAAKHGVNIKTYDQFFSEVVNGKA